MGVYLHVLDCLRGVVEAPDPQEERDDESPGAPLAALPGAVLNLRTTVSQKCEAVPRRARI